MLESGRPLIAGCDTMVTLAEASASASVVFAKNSDRPPGECQPLVLLERAEHPAGASVRCQYIDIPQSRTTARVLGSRPVWLWGFEHGVNEHGVAIGNETIFAREAPASVGLLGMDLVRLGLERASTAESALEVITELIEVHGQGGSGFREFEFPYNSSFLIADPYGAWILEAAGRYWAARRCHPTDAISNQITIEADWDRLSARTEAYARERGLPLREPFDFSAAYRDVENVPAAFSAGRLRQSRQRLAAARGAVTIATMRDVLRDHDSCGARFRPGAAPEDEQYFTICMHEGPSQTTASMIVALERGRSAPAVAFVSFGRPCASVFFPVILAGELPRGFTQGSDERDDGLWWACETLGRIVERDPSQADLVRGALDPLEASLAEEGSRVQRELATLAPGAVESYATERMADVARRVEATVRSLLTQLAPS